MDLDSGIDDQNTGEIATKFCGVHILRNESVSVLTTSSVRDAIAPVGVGVLAVSIVVVKRTSRLNV